MAVTYQIDQAKCRIHTRCVGAVTLDEVQQHFADLVRDPECPEHLDVLLDLSEITSLPTSSQLSAVTTEIARVRPRVQFDGCAIIASRDAVFGMARMFEVFAERYFRATRVFRAVDEGTRWLELEPVARSSGGTRS
jgi:hypothetical protein